MIAVVSPYHVTTREPPAMASLLLADEVLTLLPVPAGASDALQAQSSAGASHSYLEMMRTWAWAAPLWKAGVISGDLENDSPLDDVREVTRRIADDPECSPLHSILRPELFEHEAAYLAALGADILKRGPDPAINVPIAAGLDRFAIRHRLLVARSTPTSFVQHAEQKLARPLASIAIPVLVQASAERLILAREVLEDALEPLRRVLAGLAESSRVDAATLTSDAEAYARAFTNLRPEFLDDSREDDVRPVECTVVLTVEALPFDAVVRSSLAAMRHLVGARSGASPAVSDPSPETAALAPASPGDSGEVIAMVVKALGTPTPRPAGLR